MLGCLAEIVAGFLSMWWWRIPMMIGSANGDEAGGKALLVCLAIKAVFWLGERASQPRQR